MIKHKEGIREAFAQYEGVLPSSVHRQILQTYYAKIVDRIIFDNLQYMVPGVGKVLMVKVKPKLKVIDGVVQVTLPIDWPATRKHGKIIYHPNVMYDGYVFRIKLDKVISKSSKVAKFYPSTWTFKRYLAKQLKNEEIKLDAVILYK